MSVQDKIPVLPLIDGEGMTIFDRGDRYVVPLYQRAFAWGEERYSAKENEIIQLIDDVMEADGEYFLGSLVVYKRANGYFEVIDGQQRLTALLIIFTCLGYEINEDALSYDCRNRSNYALGHIDRIIGGETDENFEPSICLGVECVNRKLNDLSSNFEGDLDRVREEMRKALSNARLFRIEVPAHTDLNHYFEVMNTRGEQLEQTDIVKANLMEALYLSDEYQLERERMMFAEVWDACADMTGYVQMHLKPDVRQYLFGSDLNGLPNLNGFRTAMQIPKLQRTKLTLEDVLNGKDGQKESVRVNVSGNRVRFEPIIDFPNFLIHVLRVFRENVLECGRTKGLVDDKKLIDEFKFLSEEKDDAKRNKQVLKFVTCLLQCRFLFDKFIIKREYTDDANDGEWSLKMLRVSKNAGEEDGGEELSKTGHPHYVQTEFKAYCERRKTAEGRKQYNRMLQACLRVSYTSPKVMHWITRTLAFLHKDYADNPNSDCQSCLHMFLERIAIRATREFLDGEDYALGIGTPHLVLNYLDFLLWDEAKDDKDLQFEFEFRNSVEHWYPRNPSEGTFERWEEEEGNGVDRFGNLCLLSRRVNSKFSNLSPESKLREYEDMVAKGSLKLRKMAEITQKYGSNRWRSEMCAKHEEEMLHILRDAVDKYDDEEEVADVEDVVVVEGEN